MDIVIIVILLLLVILLFKKFDNTIIFFGLIDIILRILNFIGNNTTQDIKVFVTKYFPSSIPNIISNYSSNIIETILIWGYVAMMILFCYYIVKILIRRVN